MVKLHNFVLQKIFKLKYYREWVYFNTVKRLLFKIKYFYSPKFFDCGWSSIIKSKSSKIKTIVIYIFYELACIYFWYWFRIEQKLLLKCCYRQYRKIKFIVQFYVLFNFQIVQKFIFQHGKISAKLCTKFWLPESGLILGCG